ncbi:MAG: hypothetical protein HKM00_09570 [Gallionella sp.]|nr:hypothetical protein [Gallionella sp.]
MNDPTIILTCDTALIDEALDLLSDIAQTSHEVVQGFLGGLDSLSQLVRLDSDNASTPGAGEFRVVLQPSDLLVEFLTAARAGQNDGL